MKNALHLLNQKTVGRLFAAILCFILFSNEQLFSSPTDTISDSQIQSLKIISSNSDYDSIFLVVDAMLTSSGCGIEEYDVLILDDNLIEVNAHYWQGEALAICNTVDTLFLGVLNSGSYNLTFNHIDSLSFKVPYVNNQNCKADFLNVMFDCHPPNDTIDCYVDYSQFNDISTGNPSSWQWEFGDGEYSNEQNPSHKYQNNGEYQVCLKITNSNGCESKICKTIHVNYANDSCIHKGTVVDYTGLDGCGYVIELDNGVKLEPVKIMSDIELRDSMRVKLSYSVVRMASICMVGQTAIITCIKEINEEPCHANFDITRELTVNVPNAYLFKNKSRGNNLSYYWDFGDGNTSVEENPLHSYADTGIYIVCLKIYNENGCEDKICKRLNVGDIYPNCKAQFRHQYMRCDTLPFDYCPGYFVQFNNESYGDDLVYTWNFGDGNVSYEQNPSHFYDNAGYYTVTLKVETATDFRYCTDNFVKQIKVGVTDSMCNAYYEYEALTPNHYRFMDLSHSEAGDAMEVNWNFGDGTFEHGKEVEHVYKAPGVYRVCVTSTTPEGCTSSYCRKLVVGDTIACQSTFEYENLLCECLSCACFNFISHTNDDVVEWFWDFGDGNYSHEPDPYHTYYTMVNKQYTVCLTTLTASGCKSVYCKNIRVHGGGYDVPWEPVVGGDENHIIIVPEDINAPDLANGDYLGLFFKDPNGNDICGGMLEWKGDVSTLTAWGASSDNIDLPTNAKNGFLPGEKFGYKIWKHASNQIIEIDKVRYSVDAIITDSSEYRNDGLSQIVSLKSCDSQNIRLHRGWNLISLNTEPSNKKMKDIFGNNQNVLVKDAAGEIKYFPYVGIEDGEWDILEGYKIKVWENTGIKVCGTSIDAQTSIPLHGNMYPDFLPYYYQFEYPIEYALHEIKDDIRYVQSLEYLDGTGKIMALNYIPSYGINQIGNMKPGLAYKLSLLTTLKSFTYPHPWLDEPFDSIAVYDSINKNTETNQLKAGFEDSDKNRILVIPENVIDLNTGDEINIYTSDNFFAGSWLYNGEGNTAVTLWDNPDMPDYDEFEIRIVDSDRNEVASYSVNIDEDVNVDGSILELKSATTSSRNNLTISDAINVYPNPASNNIRFELSNEDNMSKISIQVYDLEGRVLIQENTEFNGQAIELKIDNLNNGIYILQVQTENNVFKSKFAKR